MLCFAFYPSVSECMIVFILDCSLLMCQKNSFQLSLLDDSCTFVVISLWEKYSLWPSCFETFHLCDFIVLQRKLLPQIKQCRKIRIYGSIQWGASWEEKRPGIVNGERRELDDLIINAITCSICFSLHTVSKYFVERKRLLWSCYKTLIIAWPCNDVPSWQGRNYHDPCLG